MRLAACSADVLHLSRQPGDGTNLEQDPDDGEGRDKEGRCHCSRQRPELDGVLQKGPHHPVPQHLHNDSCTDEVKRQLPSVKGTTAAKLAPCFLLHPLPHGKATRTDIWLGPRLHDLRIGLPGGL